MAGIAREIVSDSDREDPTGRINLPTILEHGHDVRFDFYCDLLGKSRIAELGEVLSVLRTDSAKRTLERQDIEQFLTERYNHGLKEVLAQIRWAIEVGTLERRPDVGFYYYDYAIPSFETFMHCRDRKAHFETHAFRFAFPS